MKGTGTPADPYIVEFLDSEEFQVESGQIRTTASQVLSSANSASTATGFNKIDYETPSEIFLAFVYQGPYGSLYVPTHRFWFASAHATFVSNGSANGNRRMYIQWRPPADNYWLYSDLLIAGTSTTGLPGAEDITLNCSGLVPFADFTERKDYYGPGGTFSVWIQQNTGSSMTVKDVIFTVVAL